MKTNLEEIKKFNWWFDNDINEGFRREEYLQRLQPFTGNKLVKVLVGQRRAGKSFVLRQLMKDFLSQGVPTENTLYINKEFIEFSFLETDKDLNDFFNFYLKEMKPKGKVYLFIDEVQNIVGWERFVNSKSQDFTRKCELFITGSNSKLLSGELATLLSGRYVSFEILPYSFQEYCEVYQKQQNRLSYVEYMQTSGLPELVHLPDEETKRHYLSSVIDTIMLRDIIQRHKIQNASLLKDIFSYLTNNASNLISLNSLVTYFKGKSRKTTYDTLANYVNHIEDTYLIHRVERYDLRGKETIGGVYKFYLNDLGYKNFLFSGTGYGLGYLLENLVFLQLKRAGFEIYIGNIANNEVDFYAQRNDFKLYLQVCYSIIEESTQEREYRSLLSIDDNYPKWIVSMDDFKMPNREGIEHIQAWNLDTQLKQLMNKL